ncbi:MULTISPECIES: helix-turn-helix domain-containing protein [Mumia]|uniref:helix-turn-helix domain-containing protein n=1 Tax=Mumia TaxID=1546255 RepID=UPI00141DF5AE|nr:MULTISPECIES: helix-turn-helix domain-containing protein [unclassified Mumia]QMW66929.1 helix-turn-helix domain-containing protein [Mumia sp. ZJ1417]
MTSLLLRPIEAAEQLGIGRTKLYELMSAGKLGYVQIGALRRVPLAALEKFIADNFASVHQDSSDAPHATADL